MHDLLFSNQGSWANASDPSPIFRSYATQIGLNLTNYDSSYASTTVNNLINGDIQNGISAGVTGVQTYYFSGVKANNSSLITVQKFSATIDSYIK